MSNDNKQQPIVIIGAGIGGLSAAIRLAAVGKKVIVLEKNQQTGGKMGIFEADHFRWDIGPSVITMRHVFEELFHVVGKSLDDYIQLLPIEPLTRYFYADGTILDASANIAKMSEQITRLNEHDLEGYLAYLAYASRIHRIAGPVFIYNKPPELSSFAQVPIQDWLKVDPFRTMQQSIQSFVRSPHIQQFLGRFATYVGGSPFSAPATLNVIAAVELLGGVWYPKGGIYTIAQAMTRLAQETGVEIFTNKPVQRIEVAHNHVCGVTLQDNTTIETDTVIANVDVTTVYKYLLPPTPANQSRLAELERYEPSTSGFIMLLGVSGTHRQLAHHNILFSTDYQAEFDTIFRGRSPFQEPTIYIAITSRTDPDHAPQNCENWFVLVNVPALSDHWDWQIHSSAYRDAILTRIESFGFDIKDSIRSEKILTPDDLSLISGAWRGALYGASPNSRWAAFRRPHNRSPIHGLYFAGGTTHPGGGVPLVALSGKVAAELILADQS